MHCPNCHESALFRIPRIGFSDTFRSLFGFYPWCCRSCKLPCHLRDRGRKVPRISSARSMGD